MKVGGHQGKGKHSYCKEKNTKKERKKKKKKKSIEMKGTWSFFTEVLLNSPFLLYKVQIIQKAKYNKKNKK